MDKSQLRDHAKQIIEAIALDLETPQSERERDKKSKGKTLKGTGPVSAASSHGTLRQLSGFTLLQLTAEFRALRASVMKLWHEQVGELRQPEAGDLIRFNEAIDQALFESVVEFSAHEARSRDTFLAMLGHDLRSPLSAMVAAGEFLLLPGAARADIRPTGERVRRSALMMSGMVNDLLEYSRSQLGGSMPVKTEASDLRAVAVDAIRDASAVHPDCPYQLQADGDFSGEFDPTRIQQVITNLLTNAAQYRDKHYSVKLLLSADSERLNFAVENRGPVIPVEAFEAIFNPLVQLAQVEGTGRSRTSIGLGLFIAKVVANAHGGTISVASTEKQGTIFTVSLPRKAA